MIKYILFFSICIMLCITNASSSTFLNSVSISGTPQENGNDITFSTSGTVKVRVSLCSPDLARFWVDPSGLFSKDSNYTIDKLSWPTVTKTITDKSTYYQILTSELSIRIDKNPARISLYKADNTTLVAQERSTGGTGWSSPVSYWDLGADEHIFGIGGDNEQKLGVLDRRGTERHIWNGMKNTAGMPSANISVPFFMSTGRSGLGYGMYFDNTYDSYLNMGKESNNYFYWKSTNGSIIFYFFVGPKFDKILDKYTELTGRPMMPPLWATGFIQSKCQYWSWDEITTAMNEMRKRSIPVDVFDIDAAWPDCQTNFKWNSRWSKVPTDMVNYNNKGINFLTYFACMAHDTCSGNTYSDALSKNLFAKCNGTPCKCGYFDGRLWDPTATGFKEWLWSAPNVKRVWDEGSKSFNLDLTEPEGEPTSAVYAAGPTAKIHNVYSNLFNKAFFDGQKMVAPNTRVFLLTRCGFTGIQKYAGVWTGDIYSDYETFESQLPHAQNCGMSGIPWWTNDCGGFQSGWYKNDQMGAHALLYQRWMQFTSFAPLYRAHKVGNCEPYSYTASVEAVCKKYIELRYKLMPYSYTYGHIASQTGAPILRALPFEYQNDPATYKLTTEFLVGKEILVAPVVKENTTTKSVYFPQGNTWYDYDNGKAYAGGTTATVDAPLEKLPLFVKSGAIIPMAPVMQYTSEKPWNPITLDIYPEGTSSFTMYKDDGVTMDYSTSQKFTTTEITSTFSQNKQEIVTITESNKQFTPASYEYKIHFPSQTIPPSPVQLDGKPVDSLSSQAAYTNAKYGRWWDATNKILWVKTETTTALTYSLSVSLDGSVVSTQDLNNAGAYPNCFDLKVIQSNVKTQMIHFAVPYNASSLKIDICNLQGRSVATVANGVFSPGYHSVPLIKKGSREIPGTGWYFCRMKAHNFEKTSKVFLTK